MDFRTILHQLGLNSNQSAMYQALLEQSPLSVVGIEKITQLHRPTIYRELPMLLDKGLATTVVVGQRTQYLAEHPKKLQDIVTMVANELSVLLPTLEERYRNKSARPFVAVYHGRAGIRSVFLDVVASLPRSGTYYHLSTGKGTTIKADRYLPQTFRAIVTQKNLHWFLIVSEDGAQGKNVKVIPSHAHSFNDNISQIVYCAKVAFIDYESETATVIDSPALARFHQRVFMLLYHLL